MLRKWLTLIIATLMLAGCLAGPVYKGPKSDHFDGKSFKNTVSADKSLWALTRLAVGALFYSEKWPKYIASKPQVPPVVKGNPRIGVTFINHSTVLLQVDGVTILTDPMYSLRASPVSFAGPRRVRAPGVQLDDLPPIDVILISHNHYDHLDIDTLQRLQQRQPDGAAPLILAGLGVGGLLQANGIHNYKELDWEQDVTLKGLRFVFTECRHRSGRGMRDQMKTLWGSFVVQGSAGNIYFAGDTGYGPHFKATRQQYGPFRLALLPIGAYEPRWFMAAVHLNPAEAVKAHLDLDSRQSVAIHFGTFQLTYEGIDQPVIDLENALRVQAIDKKDFWVLDFGETRVLN